ncbi:MAG: hypothetical protein ACE5HI_13875, partial [bacterium]
MDMQMKMKMKMKMKIKRLFSILFLCCPLLFTTNVMFGQRAGADVQMRMLETDQTLPAGLWRIRLNGDTWTLERNTAAVGNFSTFTTPLSINNSGNLTFSTAFGTSIDLGTTTLLASRAITVDTGGGFDINMGTAAGDDFS